MFCGEVILNSNNCLKDVNSDSESNSDNELQTNVSNLKLDNEELIFNPYNSNNLEITSANVQELLSKYGIFTKPFNLELYKRAFIHKSYTKRPKLENSIANIIISDKPENCLPLKTKSNERLEFIGDGVLECITKYYLYKRFPKADEGFMTEKKNCISKKRTYWKISTRNGFKQIFYYFSTCRREKYSQ